jgi:very-short-patch-repair endonuclease
MQLGVTRSALRHLVDSEVLGRPHRGVVLLRSTPATVEQRAAVACASSPAAVIARATAGHLWGIHGMRLTSRIDASVTGHRLRLVDVSLHRSDSLPAGDIVVRSDGIRLTSPPRTVFDLAADLDDLRFTAVVEQVLREGRCTLPTLVAVGERLCAPGRRGSGRFARVVSARPSGLRPTDSKLELLVERALLEAGLPAPVRQHPIRLPDGSIVHPDFYWPVEHVALEVDHATWHSGQESSAYDRRRDRMLRAVGIETRRITDTDVRQDLGAAVTDLALLLHSRSRS